MITQKTQQRHDSYQKMFYFRQTSMFASVVWPKGRPPPDVPVCGFNNEICEWVTNGKTYSLWNSISVFVFRMPIGTSTPMSGKAQVEKAAATSKHRAELIQNTEWTY